MLDILIKNAEVIDGTGAKRIRADVAVKDGVIVDLGVWDTAKAEKVIEAKGKIVTPGFVDMHSHADFTLPVCPTADSLLYQGITTAVVGNCGHSMAPLFADTRAAVIEAMGLSDGPIPWHQWNTFADYYDFLEKLGISINIVPLLGHGVTRAGIMGFTAERATQATMKRMHAEIEKAMDSGAYGVSTGLIYPPGSFSQTAELIEFTYPIGKKGGYYFTHMRDEATFLLDAIQEAIQIGRETGVSVQISHFKAAFYENWEKADRGLELIDLARQEGLDVSADMYPYLAGGTYLKATIPEWAHKGGTEALLERLRSKEQRQHIIETSKTMGFFRNIAWEKVIFATAPRMPECEGKYIVDLASQAGISPWEWVFDALLETKLEASIVYFMMSEDNLRMQLRNPFMMIGTDGEARYLTGPMAQGLNHPRSYGTFPRILGRYVRELGILTLEEAIQKMTGLPAQKLRWSGRGIIQKNYAADLVVFDPLIINDQPTYDNPYQTNLGIEYVIVNGKIVLENGMISPARTGKKIRFETR